MTKKHLEVGIFAVFYFLFNIAAITVAYQYEKTGWVFLILQGIMFILIMAKCIIKNIKLAGYKEANDAKTQFLSKFSHDFRTPMNAIIGMTEIAAQSVNDPKEVSYCLNKITASADYMLSMLSDILDISKIEGQKLALVSEPFDLFEIIKSINAIIYVQSSGKQISFTVRKKVSSDILLIGDSIRVKQVLVNLLSNAVKFTRAGGAVRFEASETARDADKVHLCFRVMDNGIGMSQEFMKKMYEPFEREKEGSRNANTDGVGLGLAICNSLVQLMGGTIEAHSRIGEGTEFSVNIDFGYIQKERQNYMAAVRTYTNYDFGGRKVLLADDNLTNLDIAARLLRRVNVEVDMVTDGQKVVNMFLDSPPGNYDAILIDVQMPVKNGLEAAAEIRRCGRDDASAVPIVAMTAHAFAEDREKAACHGVDFYLTKPVKMQVLYETLDEIFTNSPPNQNYNPKEKIPGKIDSVMAAAAENYD